MLRITRRKNELLKKMVFSKKNLLINFGNALNNPSMRTLDKSTNCRDIKAKKRTRV